MDYTSLSVISREIMGSDWIGVNVLSFEACLRIVEAILIEHGKKLTPSMKACLGAAWEGKGYDAYIEENHLSLKNATLRTAANRMYPILSNTLNVELAKHNLKGALHKLFLAGQLQSFSHLIDANNIAISPPKRDSKFVGRKNELAKLTSTLKSKTCINVWGAPGIGKTSLVRAFTERQQLFNNKCAWVSLTPQSTLESWISETLILLGCSPTESQRETLFKELFEKKWLLVIDNLNTPEIYRHFIASLCEAKCNSKFICISSSRIDQIGLINSSESFHLTGLTEYDELFEVFGLKGKRRWHDLSQKYNHNVCELVNVAKLINAYFDGDVSLYLDNSSTVFSSDSMNAAKEYKFSDTDLQILSLINQFKQAKSSDIFKALRNTLSSNAIFNSVGNLEGQAIIEQTSSGFVVSPAVKKYLTLVGKLEDC